MTGNIKYALSQEEFARRKQLQLEYRPRVNNEDLGLLRKGALSYDERRLEVENYTQDTAAKQFRLRELSEHHLHRKRPYLALQANENPVEANFISQQPATAYCHVIGILSMQNCEGTYFDSLSKADQENIKQFFPDDEAGKHYFFIIISS